MNHTLTPWKVRFEDSYSVITSTAGAEIAQVDGTGLSTVEDEDNALFIVRAVNSHAQIVEALKVIAQRSCSCHDSNDEDWHAEHCSVRIARKALADAEAS